MWMREGSWTTRTPPGLACCSCKPCLLHTPRNAAVVNTVGIAFAAAMLLLAGCAADSGEDAAKSSSKDSLSNGVDSSQVDGSRDSGDGNQKQFKGTVSEYARKYVACLRGEGWDVELAPEGDGYISNVTADQGDAFNVARQKCSDRLGQAPGRGKVSQADMVALYEFTKGTVACLREHGWPATDPPSLDTFIQQNFFTKGVSNEPLWGAYDLVVKDPSLTEPNTWRVINKTCPQSP